MRLQHTTQAASGLSIDTPDRVQAKTVIVEEVERLRWRIWNGKARNARISIDRIRCESRARPRRVRRPGDQPVGRLADSCVGVVGASEEAGGLGVANRT
jgi:hypothetical protein